MRHLLAAMDALVATVEQETALVRAGKLKDAAALDARKAELAQLYAADTAQVKANIPALKQQVPELLAALRKQHDTFNALLQINLTVLATAHAVAEGLIRGAHSRGRAQERAADLWQLGPRQRAAAQCRDAGFGQPHAVALALVILARSSTPPERYISGGEEILTEKSSPDFRAQFARPLTTSPNVKLSPLRKPTG